MTAQELWNAYQGETANVAQNNDNNSQNNNPETTLPYAAWAFGGLTVEDTNILAELVHTGAKTATAGAYDSYLAEGCPLPKVGEYNIILDTGDNAVCITKTTAVTTMPFCEVSAEHARKEGEGDCSLAYWREVHQAFFTTELTAINKPFSITMPVVCEEFEVVFTAPKGDDCNAKSDISKTAGIAMTTPVLETERLTLRPLACADADTIFKNWASDPEVAKFMRWSTHQSTADTLEWMQAEEAAIDGNNYNFGFVLKSSGELIGSGGLVWSDEPQLYELGYNIMQAEWDKGLTTEASCEILRFAKEKLGLRKVYCCHALENIGSQKVIEKLGFTYAKMGSYESFDSLRKFESKCYFLDFE